MAIGKKNIIVIQGNLTTPYVEYQTGTPNDDSIAVTTFFINHTRYQVSVAQRGNLKYTLPCTPVRNGDGPCFIARKVYRVPGKFIPELERSFIDAERNPSMFPELMELREAYKVAMRTYNSHNRYNDVLTLIVDTVFTEQDLYTHQEFFCPIVDAMISLRSTEGLTDHPASTQSYLERMNLEAVMRDKGLHFHVSIVANDDEISDRYMLFAGEVVKIPAIRDPNRLSGVYYYQTDSRLEDQVKLNPVHLSIKDGCEKLGLYSNREDAYASGDRKTYFANNIAELQYQAKVVDFDESKVKLQQNREKHEFETEAAKEERAFKKEESQFKRFTDIVKSVPGIITGVVGVIGLGVKLLLMIKERQTA